jgi:hypothetical protein
MLISAKNPVTIEHAVVVSVSLTFLFNVCVCNTYAQQAFY